MFKFCRLCRKSLKPSLAFTGKGINYAHLVIIADTFTGTSKGRRKGTRKRKRTMKWLLERIEC
jgi:hypothetical protein